MKTLGFAEAQTVLADSQEWLQRMMNRLNKISTEFNRHQTEITWPYTEVWGREDIDQTTQDMCGGVKDRRMTQKMTLAENQSKKVFSFV